MNQTRFFSRKSVRLIALAVLFLAVFLILAASQVAAPPAQADGPCAMKTCPTLVPGTAPETRKNLNAGAFQKGEVFAGVGQGKIKRFTPTGTLVDTLDSTLGSTESTGMCFDNAGNLYASFFEANTLSKFNNTGSLTTKNFGSGFSQSPESCVFDSAQNMYVGQADGTHKILKFNTSGTPLANYSPATQGRGTDWIDLAADQCTVFYTSEGSSVKRFNACTNTQLTDFATSLPGGSCYALRIRPNGEVMVACSSQVNRLNSSGTVLKSYPGAALNESFLFALNLDPDGTSFWTAGYSTGQIYRIDIATGNLLKQFNGGVLQTLAGLAVFGEITAAIPPAPAPAPTVISQPSEVPESDTLLLFGGGIGGLATWLGWQWRKARSKSK